MKIIVSTALSVILLTGVFALQATKHKGDDASKADNEMGYREGEQGSTIFRMACLNSPDQPVAVTDRWQVSNR